MPGSSSPFLLSKWYLDVVTDAGAVAILYAARARWGRLRARYAAVLVDDPGGRRRDEATIRGIRRPERRGADLVWENGALDVQGAWRPLARRIRRTLLRSDAGAIQWACVAPLARAEVRCGDVVLAGHGYVECLRLSVLPWRLPFRTLRWGRHTSDRHSVVSIGWDGGLVRRWAWLDGEEQPEAALTERGVHGLSGGAALTVEAGRVVRDRGVTDAIRRIVPSLAARASGPLGRMREVKHLGRSAIAGSEGALDQGWTLHEVVTW